MSDRKSIPRATKLRLFSAACGHCQQPECLRSLFPSEMGGDKHIAEMAHVIPHGEKGPRHDDRPPEGFDPDAFENLILLCPTCHAIIDKDPDAYPRGVLLEWKQLHLANLAREQGIRAYGHRSEVRGVISEVFAENKAIWEAISPVDGAEFEYDPEADKAVLWKRRMRSVILPNHYRVISIIQENLNHATEPERQEIAKYKEHVRGLVERHVCDVAGDFMRFPPAMERIFE